MNHVTCNAKSTVYSDGLYSGVAIPRITKKLLAFGVIKEMNVGE